MPSTPQSVDLSASLSPRSTAQRELLAQLTRLEEELRPLDGARERLFVLLERSPESPAETLARSFMASATSPFAKLERHRRAVQNQYWKLVRLFHQLADLDEDQDGDAQAVDCRRQAPAPAPDGTAPTAPSEPADPSPTPPQPHAPHPAQPVPHRRALIPSNNHQPSRPASATALQSACRQVADTLLHGHTLGVADSTPDVLHISVQTGPPQPA